MASTYRTRFAPTPSGVMHWGHARTHLVTWLRARSQGGRILMRFDDLDTPRVRPGSIDDFLQMHEWLGLDFDEGPFFQSARKERYENALTTLSSKGRLYACACSRATIEAQNPGPAGDGGLRYPGTCRDLALPFSANHALRLRWEGLSPGFEDAVYGAIAPGMVHGDFVLKRADGVIAYHLASVVDDLELGVSEVIRGEDLLLATSRQLLLIDALNTRGAGDDRSALNTRGAGDDRSALHTGGAGDARSARTSNKDSAPRWLHLPLLYGPDGQRLAKSLGSPGVHSHRDAGHSPQALLGALAFSLGLTPTDAPADLHELLERFSARDFEVRALREARAR